jgi:hypothetical protein
VSRFVQSTRIEAKASVPAEDGQLRIRAMRKPENKQAHQEKTM